MPEVKKSLKSQLNVKLVRPHALALLNLLEPQQLQWLKFGTPEISPEDQRSTKLLAAAAVAIEQMPQADYDVYAAEVEADISPTADAANPSERKS